jgi:hypothetical protein
LAQSLRFIKCTTAQNDFRGEGRRGGAYSRLVPFLGSTNYEERKEKIEEKRREGGPSPLVVPPDSAF